MDAREEAIFEQIRCRLERPEHLKNAGMASGLSVASLCVWQFMTDVGSGSPNTRALTEMAEGVTQDMRGLFLLTGALAAGAALYETAKAFWHPRTHDIE